MVPSGQCWTGACSALGIGRKGWSVLGFDWGVLATGALIPRGASPEGPLAGSFYPATCTGGRSAPPLNPPGWGTEHPLPPLKVMVFAPFKRVRHGVVWKERWSVAARPARRCWRKASRERGAAVVAKRRPRPRWSRSW